MGKKKLTVAEQMAEMKQLCKESDALLKRGLQLMKKLKAGTISIDEDAELDRIMRKDMGEKRDQLMDSTGKFIKAMQKK